MNERIIFDAAVEIADPQARRAFIEQACGGNPDKLAAVVTLLKSHTDAGSFLEVPAARQIGPVAAESSASDDKTRMFASAANAEAAGEESTQVGPQSDLGYLQPSSKPGSIGLLGHYEVLQILGRGAFGLVFKAFDEKLHRMVAIKVLNPALAATSPPRKRFLREARSSAAVRHENIVAIHAVEEEPVPYLVMEYIPGKTLQQWLDEHGPLDSVDVLKFGQQIAVGLAAAHAQGLIHRDIKPANILVDTSIEARIKITDFGLARAVDDASMTQSGLIAGTPMYMAPEQARGQTLDHRADLFSLGTVLYTMASGRPPFRASNTIAVLKRVCEDTPRPVSEVIPGSPTWLDEIIAKLHAKEPDDRFQTAKEVADLLARYLIQPPSSSPHAPREKSRTSPDANRANNIVTLTASTPRSAFFTRSVKATMAVLVAVALIAAFAFNRNATKNQNLASRAASAPGQAESTDSTNPDRRAAEWVLSIGGKVIIKENDQERPVTVVGDLPRGTFELTGVDMGKNPTVSNAALAVFKDCKNVKALDLNVTQVSDEGLAFFKDCKSLGNLALAHTQISNAGLIHFKECKNLSMLYLDGTKVSDAGLAHLKDCKNFMILTLANTRVSDAGLEQLADYSKLSYVGVGGTKVTEAGVKKLSAALPGCKIEWDGGVIEPRTGWHGWSADAPPPAIAPFDAEQAKQHQAAWAKYLGVPVEYTNSLGMKFRLIPPGEFLMGSTAAEIEAALKEAGGGDKHWQECIKSEAPQHKVILTQPIYLGVNEVMQADYEKVMGVNPSHFAPLGAGKEAVAGLETAEHPVEMVSWNDAAEFCAKLSQQEKLKPFYFRAGETITPLDGTGYRLPSEAEWEFACRAGTATKYWIGDKDEDLVLAGWFGGNSGGRTHAAGELKANPFGLADMHGNIWEWVQDGWDATWYGQFQKKPSINSNSPFSAGSQRVLRGGYWATPASHCRSSYRHAGVPASRDDHVGFRVSLVVDTVQQALKVDGAKIVKPGVPVGANGNPVAEQGRSAWDDLDPAQIPEAERVPFQPKELVAVLGTQRQRHWHSAYGAVIRADGKQAATCAQDGIRFWDLQTFQEQAHLSILNTPELPLGAPVSLLYTPDGRSLFAGHGVSGPDHPLVSEIDVSVLPPRLVRSWNLPNNLSGITFLAEISPSGRFLSGRGEYHGKGFLVERTETELKVVAEFPDASQISFAPDEKSVALTTRTGGTVRLFDFQDSKLTEKGVLTGSTTEVADQPVSPLRDAKFSPDGRLLVIDSKSIPWFFDVSGAEPKPLFKLDRTAHAPRFSRDGRSLLMANDGQGSGLQLWSIIDDQAKLVSSTGINGPVPRHGTSIRGDNTWNYDLAPDGKLAITGHDNGIVRFLDFASSDVTELQPVKPNPVAFGHVLARSLRIGMNGFSISSEESLGVLTWHLENGRLLRTGVVDAGYGRQLAASEDGSLLVTWETPPSRCVIHRREQNEWRAIRTVPSTIDAVCGALSHDQRRLVIGSNSGEIEQWDLEAKPPRKLWEYRTPQNQYVVQLHFAMKESMLVSEVHGTTVLQRITDTSLEPFFTVPTAGYSFTDVAPNGESMAHASLHALSTWSLTSDPPQQIQQLSAPQAEIEPRSVAYAPDGRQLAVAYANGQIWLHDLESGLVSRKLQLPGGLRHVLFTTDNRHLITANGNGTIYVLRLQGPPTK